MAWGSNPKPIKSPTRCQRLAIAATFEVWFLAQNRRDGHRSLVTPERVLVVVVVVWFYSWKKLQINTEYKIRVYQKKDTATNDILYYMQKKYCYINIKTSSMVAAPV